MGVKQHPGCAGGTENWSLQRAAIPGSWCLVWDLAPCPSYGCESSQGWSSVGGSTNKHQIKAILVFLCVKNTNHLVAITCTAVSLRSSPLTGTDSSAVHWQPRPLHEEEEGRLVGGPADESTGQGGEGQEAGEPHVPKPVSQNQKCRWAWEGRVPGTAPKQL